MDAVVNLPPGVVEEQGQLVRYVPRTSLDGTEWQQRRVVTLNFAEAKAKRLDFYHEGLQTWILEGIKKEKDTPPADIMADTSVPVTTPTDDSGDMEGEFE